MGSTTPLAAGCTTPGSWWPTWAGVDGEGTWAMALVCSTCSNPAPPYFTLVEACE